MIKSSAWEPPPPMACKYILAQINKLMHFSVLHVIWSNFIHRISIFTQLLLCSLFTSSEMWMTVYIYITLCDRHIIYNIKFRSKSYIALHNICSFCNERLQGYMLKLLKYCQSIHHIIKRTPSPFLKKSSTFTSKRVCRIVIQ